MAIFMLLNKKLKVGGVVSVQCVHSQSLSFPLHGVCVASSSRGVTMPYVLFSHFPVKTVGIFSSVSTYLL